MNRVQLLVDGKPDWVTMPLMRAYQGTRRVNEILINNTLNWQSKFLKTIATNYGRAPYFREIYSTIESLISHATVKLVDFNTAVLGTLIERLRLDHCAFIMASSLEVEGKATDMLIEMVRRVEGTTYLCGGGAFAYQEDEKFAAAEIDLQFQKFIHPVYPQHNTREFVMGLSIIDALMNCGFYGARQLINRE